MKRLAKAVAWFASGSFIGTLSQVAKGKLSAVLLGPAGVGLLSQLTNVWTLANTVSGLSFYNGIVQRIAAANADGETDRLASQLSTSLIFLTTFSCLMVGVTTAFSGQISDLAFGDAGARGYLVAVILLSVPFAVTAQTYRGLLSGHRLVRPIVVAQVFSDVLGLLLFAVLIYSNQLLGAVIAFGALHVIKLFAQIHMVRKTMGVGFVLPSLAKFRWSEVRVNARYGMNGLVMSALGIGTVVIVSRWIIDDLGLADNGIFSVAWKVASLYLGAIYAAAGGYYLPSLAAAKDNAELAQQINQAVVLYLFILPPMVIGLVLGGDLLITLLFSQEFVTAALLLALMLPGDLLRVTSESVGLSFLGKRKLFAYTTAYVIWAAAFLLLARLFIGQFGLVGVALAYLLAHLFGLAVMLSLARRTFSFVLSTASWRALLVGLVASGLAGLASWQVPGFVERLLIGVVLLTAWILLSMEDESFRMLAGKAIAKVRKK